MPTIAKLTRLIGPGAALAVLASCQDASQGPPSRPEPAAPPPDEGSGTSMLGVPLDLVYVCGNKFLVTNSERKPLHVTYRVAGSPETGGLTLAEGPGGDPGYSETELETKSAGTVELYQDDQRVARRGNEGTPCGTPAMSAGAGTAAASTAGSWSAPFPWPIVAIHVSLLPDGRVLSWGQSGQPQVWNPRTGGFIEVPEPVEIFCGGHALLPDGRVLVAGGHISDDHGLPDISLFNPGSNTWSRSAPMRRGRWYPTTTTLSTGGVLILAGRDQNGQVVEEPEIWSSGSVRALSGAKRLFPYYPRAFQAPNGRVFYAGEVRRTAYLNTAGSGSWSIVGDRRYGTRDYGAAVMYDEGKILYVGGGRTTNTAEIIDLTAAQPAWQWTGSMAHRRRHHNATVLPTGEVLVTGGSEGTAFDDYTQGVHAAELWNPSGPSAGVWTTMASNAITRTYHGTSLLLPDGRVLHTGSGSRTSPNQRNAELFSPPYLFKGSRPTIASAPTRVSYGTSFSVSTPQASGIAAVSFIRLGSVTHAFDMNQRFQRLAFTRRSGALTVSAPSDPRRTPPGHYMLFILNGNRVPSVARIIRID